jgi:hypoxanthine phosphoribosyltransferase
MIATMTAPEPVIGRILLSQDQIRDRLSELAADIDGHYAGRDLVLLGVLKGAMMVVADLARMLNHDRVEIDWITVSSYGDSTTSSGVIRMLKEADLDLGGRNVLVIDDITDSGLTLRRGCTTRSRQRHVRRALDGCSRRLASWPGVSSSGRASRC